MGTFQGSSTLEHGRSSWKMGKHIFHGKFHGKLKLLGANAGGRHVTYKHFSTLQIFRSKIRVGPELVDFSMAFRPNL